MRILKIGFGFLIVLALTNCTNTREYSIDFCTNLNSDIECDPSLTIFKPGDRVYILFECNQPFIEKIVTGKFYYLEMNNRIELGSQDWKINPSDSYAYDFIDFTEIGNYELEFQDEKGKILATKKLEIK